MSFEIRPMRGEDVDAIAALSVRAWEPVFHSLRETMGERLFDHFYGDDWRTYQEADVRRACDSFSVLVAERDGHVVGFTAIDVSEGGAEGEIYMLAVDPRSEEHTSELQSQSNLVCRLLLEKKKKKKI